MEYTIDKHKSVFECHQGFEVFMDRNILTLYLLPGLSGIVGKEKEYVMILGFTILTFLQVAVICPVARLAW